VITSKKNPWLRRFRDAVAHHDEEIALEGPKAVQDAVRLGWKPIAIAVDRVPDDLPPAVPVIQFDRRLFAGISDTINSQGVVGLFERPHVSLDQLFSARGVIVVLDGVQDPGNVGTMIRLVAAFEAAGVVLTEGSADPFGPKSIRASAGTVLSVPMCSTTRAELLRQVEKRKFDLWAAAASGHSLTTEYGELTRAKGVALIFGSEGQGVSPDLLGRARKISVPISERVESLNVAAAAAILLSKLYEARFLLDGDGHDRPRRD
jgi:RNA methyltransferase, TrmH family